jgi:ribonuclease BN (tRNA processing enzyme)
LREDTGVRLTVVGCSPAWPNPGGAQSGYLVEGEGRVLLDCGPGVLARLREREGWPRVDAVVVTHFHLDHWGDLVPWTFGAMFGAGQGSPPPELWLPPGGLETLRSFGEPLAFGSMIEEVFRIREYEDARPFRAGGLEIMPVRLHHFEVATFGLRVSDGTRTLAYSGDTAPSPALPMLASGADLFLCEATLAEPEQPSTAEDGDRGHLTAGEAVAAFRESGARRLVVIHRPDELPLDDGIERAYDGLELTV